MLKRAPATFYSYITLVFNLALLSTMLYVVFLLSKIVIIDDTKTIISLIIYTILQLFPFFCIYQTILLVNGFFSNKEMSKSKKRIINVTFVIQILSAILSGLVGFGILLNFGLFISETEQTQPLPNLIMAILMAIIAPLNLIMAFVLKKVSNSINKNYKTSIEDSFAVER
jgi:hypothetical protein